MWNYQRPLLDLCDLLFGSLATYLCADALFTEPTLKPYRRTSNNGRSI